MKLYLLRHADSTLAENDDQRPLSETGREDMIRLAKFLAPLNIKVERVLHSVKLRTKQTTDILMPSITFKTPPESRAELDPLASTSIIFNQIDSWQGDSLLVGHMPFMGKLVSKLVTNKEENNVVSFHTGCMVCLEKIENNWSINWMIAPQLLKI